MLRVMRGIGLFIGSHWRGELPFWVSLAGVLLGLHAAIALLLHGLRGDGGVVVATAVVLQVVILIWQCVGMFRAADKSFQGFGGAQFAALSYAAILLVAASTVYQIAGLLASGPVARLTPVSEPQSLIVTADSIEIEGEITLRQFSELERLLSGTTAARRLVLNSEGGSIAAARGIARLAQNDGFETLVDGRCFSACTLVLMAGNPRTMTPGSRIGFHRYRTGAIERGGHQLYGDIAEEQAKDRSYLQARGLSDDFLDRIYDAAPDEMWQPSEAELRQAGVLTGG